MRKLLQIYPALGSVALGREADQVNIATPSGGCFFLEADNLCRIEKEHGKGTKP